MNILLNDQPIELEKDLSLEQLIYRFNLKATSGVAIAVNEMIIPKKEWPVHAIHENDKILLITATQGG